MTAEISRRITLAWIAAASSSALATAGCESTPPPAPPPVPPPAALISLWQDLTPSPIQAPGYGHDPNLNKPVVPWPLTLDPQQREKLRATVRVERTRRFVEHQDA